MEKQRLSPDWNIIEETSEVTKKMQLRAILMTVLKNHIERTELTPKQAAELFGVTPSRIADLMRGKTRLFELDALTDMAAAVGLRLKR